MNDQPRLMALVAPMFVLLGLVYLVPLFGVLLISVTEPQLGLGNYAQVLQSSAVAKVALTTLRICGITTILSVVIGYILAYVYIAASPGMRRMMMLFILVPLWTSVLIRTFAWLMILGDNGPVNGVMQSMGFERLAMMHNELGVVIGMTHYLVPYAMLTILAGMAGIDERLIMASRGLGAGPVLTFLKVYFPLTLPGVFAGTVLVLVLALGFYVTPIILGGGRVVMIGEYISTQILLISRWGVGSVLATLLMLLVLLTIALAARAVDLRRIFTV
ncbi:ABC transporter permease [Mesorhizobium sp. BAC0120]|uniref:ABC transporter permease n=1 Tax=Mesorhizobium sp. BAC0120 TaxID=3090670 RepID=UPI00298CE49D|nr:ABC transporter permease [Mesorhizobium sp. BAC0120]MDW6024735.1 ABC transporter permease [Mesorhizobium sp. BAC0120]